MTANSLTIAAARDALRKREITAVDLTMSCLTAMDAGDALNAFVFKTPEIALDQARAADARIAAGDAPAMCGIPLGIKDLFCTKGVPSQAASNILRGFKPEYESTVTTRLFDAGAVMLGKLNMDEFAMGSSNETSCYGNAVNPWKVDDRQLTPAGRRAGRRRRWRPICVWQRRGRTLAGRSVSLPPLPGSWGSSRPMGGSAVGASWPLRPAWIRRGR